MRDSIKYENTTPTNPLKIKQLYLDLHVHVLVFLKMKSITLSNKLLTKLDTLCIYNIYLTTSYYAVSQ